MSNKIINLIFSESISGHRLEYLHHIYSAVINHKDDFVFIVPSDFEDKKDLLNWESSSNIKFKYLTENERIKCSTSNLVKKGWSISKTIRKYVKEEKAKRVFLIDIMMIMPFAPIFISSQIKLSGILYKIYLYEKKRTFLRFIIDKIIYLLFTKSNCFSNLYVLNDEEGTRKLNKIYNMYKFQYLPDPIPNINLNVIKDLRDELNIPKSNRVYFQFGTLDRRKNTINILKAIELMSDIELNNKTFIFSGRLSSSVENEFNDLVNKLCKRVQLIVLKGFVPFETLNNLCYTSDVLFTLYSNTSQSSGTIGYAGFFMKPVIGPSKGLLGSLIRNNQLGYTLDEICPQSIKEAILMDVLPIDNNYKDTHTIDAFCSCILKSFQ